MFGHEHFNGSVVVPVLDDVLSHMWRESAFVRKLRERLGSAKLAVPSGNAYNRRQ